MLALLAFAPGYLLVAPLALKTKAPYSYRSATSGSIFVARRAGR
jgi:hypothetical protein